ncbi:hypothetical protein ATCVCan0610SP_025L [Acanthocystis turfacea Chlorella virus Can0610SP]|nr:hypothetical protein ATCVCan0610SP_025L [Acanthocystis turfacea Chlorella virus Can0610SP]
MLCKHCTGTNDKCCECCVNDSRRLYNPPSSLFSSLPQTQTSTNKAMFKPIVLETSATSVNESFTTSFVTFRKSLKASLSREYESVHGPLEEKKNTKQLMRALKKHSTFEHIVTKGDDVTSSQAAGEFLASVTLMVYKFMCSLNMEFEADDAIKALAGIIQDGPSKGANERISYALGVLNNLCEDYVIMDGFITDKVDKITTYFEEKLSRS